MKKFLLSLACVSAMAWSASAAEVTFDFSAQGYANAQEVLSIKVNDEISATLTKGSNNNTPKYYTTGNALRLYSGNTFELTSTNGNITKVVFTMGSSNPFNAAATATPGALDVATATWTGDAKTFTITNGSGSGHARVEKMTITYGGTGGGGEVTPPKPEDKTVADIAGFLNAAYTEANTTISGSVNAVYQNGRYLYIKDNSGVLLVYGDLTEKYTNGMTIPGGITGLYENRTNGQFQMKNLVTETFKAGTAGAAIEPDEIALEELSADMVNNYVVIPNVTITAGADARNFTVTDATGSAVLYNQFNDERYYDVVTVTTGENLTLKGIVAVYNGNVQLYPVEITSASGQEVVAAPVFSVAAGTVPAGTTVEITCATEGASIFYTLDGTEPTIQSTLYNGPITINETTTVKAFAVKEEMVNSSVVAATYTVKALPAVAETAMFDFVNPTTLNPAQQNPGDGQEGAIVVSDLTFTAGNAAISFTDGSTTTRLYKDYNKGNQLRLYKNGGSVTVKAAEGYVIKYVSFVGSKLTTMTENGTALDDAEDALWIATGDVTEAKFETTTDRVDIFSLTVGLDKVGAVEDINFDANEPVEYYNLQGVRVANPENGLYIRRQGSKVSKVLVK